MEEFVRKEVFDETIKRFEAELKAEREYHEKLVVKLTAAFELQRVKNKKLIDELIVRLNDSKRNSDRLITFLGICVTAASLLLGGLALYVSVIAPAIH